MAGLREALEESYDQIDGAGLDGADVVVGGDGGAGDIESDAGRDAGTADETPVAAEAGDRPRDEQGRFLKADAKPAQEKPSAAPTRAPAGPAAGQGAAAGTVPPPVPAAAPAFRAPQAWKAALREQWGALPPAVQEEIARREKEISAALQKSAEAEKGVGGWTETVRPYEAQIRAQGLEPQKYVGNLLQTAHALTYGQPLQKADIVASLALQFGVTPQDLDQRLVARMQGQGQAPQAQPQQFRDPRMDQWIAEREAERAAEAEEHATSFADQHEFFGDVAAHVADILDVWAKQGKKSVSEQDIERAYDIACQMNDDVRSVLEQRRQAESVRTAQAATARAAAAASSVRSQPTAGNPAQPAGRRAALEAAYDELSG